GSPAWNAIVRECGESTVPLSVKAPGLRDVPVAYVSETVTRVRSVLELDAGAAVRRPLKPVGERVSAESERRFVTAASQRLRALPHEGVRVGASAVAPSTASVEMAPRTR